MLLAFPLIFVFVVGASVGSFLNVVVARLPLEKSLLWPNSRCGNCLQSIRWYDNLPLISYLWLRGKCRTCGQRYSIVYFLVELGAGLGFVALFWLEIVQNVHGWPGHPGWAARLLSFPWTSWLGFAWHATLFSFLLAASVCDLNSREIPLQLTLTGTLIGLIGAVFMPWPFPQSFPLGPGGVINQGIYAWPFWWELPDWCGAGGNWQTGLTTGFLGALVGTFLLRTIGFIFSSGLGKEALGLGDADLMMMAGAFLGWQVVLVGFFASVIPALFFGIIQWVIRNDNALPFGPSLSMGVMATCLGWRWIGEPLRPVLYSSDMIIALIIACAIMLFVMSFALRLIRRKEDPTP